MPPEADQLYEWAFWSQDPIDALRIAAERRCAAGLTSKEVRAELSEFHASLRQRRRDEDGEVVLKAMDALSA
jgi:hypothetical protein